MSVGITFSKSNYVKNMYSYHSDFSEISYRKFIPLDFAKKVRTELNNNKSQDMMITGGRGEGKSTLALAIASKIDLLFTIRNVVFTGEQFLTAADELEKGSVLIIDEAGTQQSGLSSRNFMSSDNKDMSDVWQMIRTKQIMTIMISLDSGRIDNRVRDTFQYFATPVAQLSDEDTFGKGLSIMSDIRTRGKKIKSEMADDDLQIFSYQNQRLTTPQHKQIAGFIFPLPNSKLIYDYETKRDNAFSSII